MEEDCLKQIRCANCRQDHPAYIRSCNVYKKEKEILERKYKRNVSFLEARKIVGTYIGENSYVYVSWKAATTNQDNKYRTLMEKLIQLEANDWPMFQEHQKKLHSPRFYQAPAQQWVGNGKRFNVLVQAKTHVGSSTPTQTNPPKSVKSPTKQPLHKSPIRPPKSTKGKLKNLSPIKHEQHKLPLAQAGKIQMNTKMNNERPGSTFKMPSRTKSPIKIKQYSTQGLTKPLQRTYSIESMDTDTDCVVASLNLEEMITAILETI